MMNIFVKSNEDRLYWLIEQYLAGRINEKTFCNEFYYSYNLEVDISSLSNNEKEVFDSIRQVTDRFSDDDDSDVEAGVYTNKKELRQVVESAKMKLLLSHNWITTETKTPIDVKENLTILQTLLDVNRNARQWSAFINTIPSTINTHSVSKNRIVINFIIPGSDIPVAFSGMKFSTNSDSDTGSIEIEIALPDVKFPEHNLEEAQDLILKMISDAYDRAKVYGDKETARLGEEIGTQLRRDWIVEEFTYDTPEDLPYVEYEYSDGSKTGVYTERIPGHAAVEHSFKIGRDGRETE